jgi:hypothetical protein
MVKSGLVRIMQFAGRSEEKCGEYMCNAIFDPKFRTGFHLLDQYGKAGPTATPLHEKVIQLAPASSIAPFSSRLVILIGK